MNEHIIINKDRSVVVPNSEKKIGIQFDHNVNKITFDCPRYADDNEAIDMSRMQVFLNYMLSDKTTGCTILENVVVDETDPTIIHFDWTVTRNHTLVNGVLSTLICIKQTDTEGNELYHWNTNLFQQFTVGDGMECSEMIVDENPDVITQLLVKMDAVDARTSTEAMQGYVNEYFTQNPVEASQSQVNTSVNTYFTENPPSPSDQQVSSSVNAYLNQNPPTPTDEQANTGINTYMNEHAQSEINVYMVENAQSCVNNYLTEHPVSPTEEQMKQGVAANSELLQNSVNDYLGKNPLQLDENLTDPTKAAPANKVGEIQSDVTELKGDIINLTDDTSELEEFCKKEIQHELGDTFTVYRTNIRAFNDNVLDVNIPQNTTFRLNISSTDITSCSVYGKYTDDTKEILNPSVNVNIEYSITATNDIKQISISCGSCPNPSNFSIYANYSTITTGSLEERIDNCEQKVNKVEESIEVQKEFFVDDYNSVNRCDNSAMNIGYKIDITTGNAIEDANYSVTDYIPINGLTSIALYACLTDALTPFQEFWRGAWYKKDKTFLSGLNNHPTQSNPDRGVLSIHEGAYYVRACFAKNDRFNKYMCTSDGSIVDYVPYSYGHRDIIIKPDWVGKNWLSYGNSITAIGNPNYVEGQIGEIYPGSWQQKVRDYLHMGKCYGRGIGGQTFTFNKRPWFANADGTYNSRDDSGDISDTSSYTVPTGCTAHYGYFASWDRITTMIPDSIKDTIDLITVFGVNDSGLSSSGFNPTTWNPPEWKRDTDLTGNKDEFWLSASESIFNGVHGDFDIDTIDGAIASTIMKLQARCPNAVIVFGTSWSGKGGGTYAVNTGNYESGGKAYYYHRNRVRTVAEYYSIPVIDIWGTSGVNCFNRNANNQDDTHPYKTHGKMMLARAWIGGLNGIVPMLD